MRNLSGREFIIGPFERMNKTLLASSSGPYSIAGMYGEFLISISFLFLRLRFPLYD